ncbi:hypothetical protein PGAG_00092 [Phaeocystis globosa virus 12T]|uniref:Uncharacterized protein n=1 Tax=Phaeocystis globosa virus PgV-16T TaxID=3071227 RepID=A0AC59EWX5_9VIRU|nr:hypothetical protein PGCG_00132 [Phaeocystis globosa virus]AET72981.1 hypothetical protein PGAG_00092 [Phaeocystis globosa virus 12T]AET73802.1 hypothetical protein PGBG_00094 [Phaeocystis globosa virus 14T]AGM15444.1 hypothetical protein PGCG_00132 [Phaeocystis globosa virus PgV-16T]UYE94174.1 hypothetical protein PGV14T_00132 [Phaeocystis globosa virus]
MKSINFDINQTNTKQATVKPPPKTREKFIILSKDMSDNIIQNINNHKYQVDLINKLYLNLPFPEQKFVINELKTKILSYKQQDIKKTLHEQQNLITLDEVIEKIFNSKLKCYYCNQNMFILFDKVRDSNQWTLDRLNNYDEHSNSNTIIACLKCNLERRRKNSEKFKFTKQLQTNQFKITKAP